MKQTITPVQVVILTPIAVECRAVGKHLDHLKQEMIGGRLYATGFFKGRHHHYEVVLQETGSKNATLALAAENAIRRFQPAIILLVGIAGGVKDVRIGDVVVGTQAYGYESGKETDKGPVARPNVLPYSEVLIETARLVSRKDAWRQRTAASSRDAKVFFGPIASGDKVIASTASPLYKYLKRHYNDTLALEMESIGFAQAVNPHRQVHALNIRAVSDLLDHKSDGDEAARQEMAADKAAGFVMELLYELNASPFMIPVMDAKTLAKEIYALLFPLPESIREIGNDFANAGNNEIREIWKKVKPLFIEEVEELAKDPEDVDAQAGVRNGLKKALEGEEELRGELAELVEMAKSRGAAASISVVNSKNVVAGSSIQVGGDFRVGDG